MVKPKPKSLLKYESVQKAFQNITLANGKPPSDKTKHAYVGALSFCIEFCNGEEGSSKEWNPDLLIEEAREDVKKAQLRIVNLYQWLQGENVSGYKSWTRKNGEPRKVSESSARQRAYSALRGFYSNNDIMFPKSFKCPTIKVPKAIQADQSVPFFKRDERNGKFVLDRGLLKHFMSNLKLRDQAVMLSLLSTSQDSGDLFSLNVGWARMQMDSWKRIEDRGEKAEKRFYWHSNRAKTRIEFRVFFTKETTEFVRRYLEQERSEAKDDEPLFVTSGNDHGNRVQRRMESKHIGDIFRDVAQKMGVSNGGRYQNPLRPKRLRHIFRTACAYAGIEEGYANVFMGHKSTVSQTYLEKPAQVLEIEYSKIEPLLTVFGVAEGESVRHLEQQLIDERARRAQLQDRMEELESVKSVLVKEVESLKSHAKTVDRVLDLLDVDEKDAKVISEMIQDYRERKQREKEAEDDKYEEEQKEKIKQELKKESGNE